LNDPRYLIERHPRRLALVVGNFDYKIHGDLPGVQSDISGVVSAFEDLNFDLIHEHPNVPDWDSFNFDVFKPFRNEIQRDDLVVIYLSGHGFAYEGNQYFAPSGMPKQVELGKVATTAIPVESLITALGREGPAAVLLIIDACRTIPDDLIIDATGKAVQKGEYKRKNQTNAVEYILALSVELGLPSSASTDPGKMSVYTSALLNHFEPDLDFRMLHDDVEFDVQEATDAKQKPGLHEYSMTPIFLSNTESWAKDERELWESVLSEADEKKIKHYLGRRRLSPYVRSARLWLRENEGVDVATSSSVSPLAIEAAWQLKGESLGSITSSVRFRTGIDYSETFERDALTADALAPIGITQSPRLLGEIALTRDELVAYSQWITDDTGAFVPTGLRLRVSPSNGAAPEVAAAAGSYPARVERVEQRPLVERTVTEFITERVCVQPLPDLQTGCIQWNEIARPVSRVILEPDPAWLPQTWIAVAAADNEEGFLALDTETTLFQTEIGKPSHEATIPLRDPAHLGLVDSRKVNEAISAAVEGNRAISWASISTRETVDDLDRMEKEFLASNLRFQLVKAGIPADRITIVYENPEVDDNGARLRLFSK
jgi:hypothetical protein